MDLVFGVIIVRFAFVDNNGYVVCFFTLVLEEYGTQNGGAEANSARETLYKETSCNGIHKSNNTSKLRMDQVRVVEENGRIHEDLKFKRRSKLKIKISRHISSTFPGFEPSKKHN
ncbi:hypothetical protein Tco_1345375 [Tanacetum coccineum]